MKDYMKNSKIFLGLAAAGISFVCGACEDGGTNTALVPIVEHVVFEEVRPEDEAPDTKLKALFEGCYRNKDVQACQDLIAFAEYKMFMEKMEKVILARIIAEKQQTIDTYEATINNFNERDSRRSERKVKKARKVILTD